MSYAYAWARQWPLPTLAQVQDKLIGNRALTAADRLALFRDGRLTVSTDERRDEALALAARGAFFDGKPSSQRPSIQWSPFEQPIPRTDMWPMTHDEVWPAWEGKGWEVFAHRANVAVWLAEEANPWLSWGEDRHGPWGLPEVLLAAGDAGLWRRVMAHPATPDLPTLAARRLSPVAGSRGLAHVPWLHAAASLKDPTILDDLLARGFSPTSTDDHGRTPLFYAANPAQIEVLLRAGADPLARDQTGESVHRFWARTSDLYTDQVAPLLNAYTPSPPEGPLLASEVQAAFGHGARGNWQPVAQAMDRAGPTWNDWRQPVTLKNGEVREGSWLGVSALALLTRSKDPQQSTLFSWHHDACDVLPATERLLSTATAASARHETLPGLTDSMLWHLMLNPMRVQAPFSLRMDEKSKDDQKNLNDRLSVLRAQWQDLAAAGNHPVVLLSKELKGMVKNLSTWGNRSFWRDQIAETVARLLGTPGFRNPLMNQDREKWRRAGIKKSELTPIMTDRWAQAWEGVSLAMRTDKAIHHHALPLVMSALGSYAYRKLDEKTQEEQSVFCPPSVRASLASSIWLALAEGKKAEDYVAENALSTWIPLWESWKKEGLVLDASPLGSRGVTLLREQFPDQFGDMASTKPHRARRHP